MAKFKCVASGNIVEFTAQVDIDSMRGHEGYVRVEDNGLEVAPKEEDMKPLPFKAPVVSMPTRGRPRKAA